MKSVKLENIHRGDIVIYRRKKLSSNIVSAWISDRDTIIRIALSGVYGLQTGKG